MGVSVENQEACKRIAWLRKIPAIVRFLSVEPLIGPVTLDLDGIDWVIVGGESGPKARPMHPQWVRSIRDQCQAAHVPFFFKHWGEFGPVGTDARIPDSVFQRGPGFDGEVWRVRRHEIVTDFSSES